jgi:hypothetical protein
VIWTVVWVKSAEGELADLWTTAPDRQAVTDAANAIDRELRIDADRKGVPHDSGRVLTVPPLAVHFMVYPDDCLVKVTQVKRS